MDSPPAIAVVIPALDEEQAIGKVLRDIPEGARQVVVVDNGSRDRTAEVARGLGAEVVAEPRRGYGQACLTGIAQLDRPDIVVFLDGDYSDYPEEMSELVAPLLTGEADLVIGSRTLGQREKGALLPQARFGNWLSTLLIRLLFGVSFTDLGPFRALRFDALQRLAMQDRDFGWTVEMQVKAARLGLRAVEVPVRYRRRIGTSKITGTLSGTLRAGHKILWTIFRYARYREVDACRA
jgi:glycosyltransferase involved in cell wall biosynthesis